MSIITRIRDLFRPAPKWEEFQVGQMTYTNNPAMVEFSEAQDPSHFGVEQWRENFSLTAGQRSERSRKAAATKKANKARAKGA